MEKKKLIFVDYNEAKSSNLKKIQNVLSGVIKDKPEKEAGVIKDKPEKEIMN